MNGDIFGEMLMKMSTRCTKCGSVLVFEEAAGRARDLGILEEAARRAREFGIDEEKVVVCDKCWSAFTVVVGPGSYLLYRDVSVNYEAHLGQARYRAREEKERRNSVQAARRAARQCIMCGRPLGRLDAFLHREKHRNCSTFKE
jgi:ribosomal protein S14